MDGKKLKELTNWLKEFLGGHETCILTITASPSDTERQEHKEFCGMLRLRERRLEIVAQRLQEMRRECVPCWRGGEMSWNR